MIYGQRNLGITSHSVEITEIHSHVFWQSFHESNIFNEEVTKKLMSFTKKISKFFHTLDQKITLVVHQSSYFFFHCDASEALNEPSQWNEVLHTNFFLVKIYYQ